MPVTLSEQEVYDSIVRQLKETESKSADKSCYNQQVMSSNSGNDFIFTAPPRPVTPLDELQLSYIDAQPRSFSAPIPMKLDSNFFSEFKLLGWDMATKLIEEKKRIDAELREAIDKLTVCSICGDIVTDAKRGTLFSSALGLSKILFS